MNWNPIELTGGPYLGSSAFRGTNLESSTNSEGTPFDIWKNKQSQTQRNKQLPPTTAKKEEKEENQIPSEEEEEEEAQVMLWSSFKKWQLFGNGNVEFTKGFGSSFCLNAKSEPER